MQTERLFLTVDLGNSRCKLRLWEAMRQGQPELRAAADLECVPRLAGKLRSALSGWRAEGAIAAAALSSVAARELTQSVAALLRETCGGSFHNAPDCGLVNACRPPERVGRDRLYAARGALAVVGGAVVVVDAGTALTVDALQVNAAGQAVFAGGAIAPGPELLARALAEGNALLPAFEPVPGASALGTNTETALRAGVAVGFRGAARELVKQVAEAANLERAPVVLAGGAREFLLRPHPFTEHRIVVEPELVHLGLLHSAGGVG